MFAAGVWANFEEVKTNKAFALAGAFGVVICEIYKFFTWHIETITGKISLADSLNLVFPEFYLGLSASAIFVAVCYGVLAGLKE